MNQASSNMPIGIAFSSISHSTGDRCGIGKMETELETENGRQAISVRVQLADGPGLLLIDSPM